MSRAAVVWEISHRAMLSPTMHVLKWVQWALLSTSILGFVVAMVFFPSPGQAENQWVGPLMGASLLGFLAGMVVFTVRHASWIVAVGLVLFFALLGLAIFLTGMEGPPAVAGGLLVPVSIFFLTGWCVWFSVGRVQWQRRRLLERGRSVPGVLVELRRLGMSVQRDTDYPRYGMELTFELRPEGAPAFRATATELLSETEIAALAPGRAATLRYDPRRPSRAAVERWS